MKVAIVHEWLITIGGSENVFKEIALLFPEADIFTLIAKSDTINKLGLTKRNIKTSFIQKLPFAQKKYRSYFPLFPLAIESFDLSKYDLVISSSHAVAKGALTFNHQTHICYCHSPIRYVWDLHFQYLKESNLRNGFKGFIAKYLLHRIRNWDILSVNRVDHFIANSQYVAKRIFKNYGRVAEVIYPNVAVHDFDLVTEKDNYFVTCSRMVPYKKMDIIAKAFTLMPDKKLVIVGDGPDYKKIENIVKGHKNIQLKGYLPFNEMKSYLKKAKAFVFAAEEDFGILPVEAQACGTPVIAYGKGGCLETVKEGVTGLFFAEQTAQSISESVKNFDSHQHNFDSLKIREWAELFDVSVFRRKFLEIAEEVILQKSLDNL